MAYRRSRRRTKRRRSKRRKKTPSKTLMKYLKPVRLPRVFPARASVIMKTTGAVSTKATTTNGFTTLGSLQVNSINSVFNTIDLIDAAGVSQAGTSNMESAGHDEFAKIYNAYRVNSVQVSFTWYPTVTLKRLCLVMIPTVTSTTPVTNWYQAMNHPLAIKSWARMDATQGKPTRTRWNVNVLRYIKQGFSRASTTQGKRFDFNAMGAEPESANQVHFHLYLCNADAENEVDCFITGAMTVYQHTTLQKAIDDSGAWMSTGFASENVPEFED